MPLSRFEDLVIFLREKDVIGVSKRCLQRIHYLCTFRHGSPRSHLSPERVNVRVFLAAYMIAYFPAKVFESMGPLEKTLLKVSQPLIDSIEKIMREISEYGLFKDVPSAMTEKFTALLFDYLCHFKAWKVPDEKKLVLRIQHALLALYQARAHLPREEPADSKLNIEFETQITRLRSKLVQIAGRPALEKFDRDRLLDAPLDPQPGVEMGTEIMPSRMSNEELAHEVLIDIKFQLSDSGGLENLVCLRIRETFHKAFWDSLGDDLRLSPPCYVRILRVLDEVRLGLLDLAGTRHQDAIANCLDMELIKARADEGHYTWADSRRLIVDVTKVIRLIQAPSRDEETNARFAAATLFTSDPPILLCKGLEFLLDRVQVMRIDAANSRLRMIGPVIRDHGVSYEQGKFNEKLANGTIALERTTAWLRRSIASGATCPCDIHIAAILDLVSSPDLVTAATIPETLRFDRIRIRGFQADFGFLVAAASTVVRIRSVLENTDQVETIASLFAEGSLSDIGEAAGLAFHDSGFTTEPLEKIRVIVQQANVKTDPVYKLM